MFAMLHLSRFLILSWVLGFIGCASNVKHETPLFQGALDKAPDSKGETKAVIFNNSNKIAFGMDGSGRLALALDGKGVCHLNIGEYVQVVVPRGTHQLKLTHWDVVNFTSNHSVRLDAPIVYVEAKATIVSNEATVFPGPPKDFRAKYMLTN